MISWSVKDASSRFDELLGRCLDEGAQMLTRDGLEVAVLVPAKEWRRLQACATPSLKELLLTDDARAEIPVLRRGSAKTRRSRSGRV